jgi:hypothetical protein
MLATHFAVEMAGTRSPGGGVFLMRIRQRTGKIEKFTGVERVPHGHVVYEVECYREGGNVWMEAEYVTTTRRVREFHGMRQIETMVVTITVLAECVGGAYDSEQIVTCEIEVASSSSECLQIDRREQTRTISCVDPGPGRRLLLEDRLMVC